MLVVCFWVAAMSWLAGEKILPVLLEGDPPDYRASLQESEAGPVCWQIKWEERPIGFAATQVLPPEAGCTESRRIVHFAELPLESMAGAMLGPLAAVIRPLLSGSGDLQVETLIATELG